MSRNKSQPLLYYTHFINGPFVQCWVHYLKYLHKYEHTQLATNFRATITKCLACCFAGDYPSSCRQSPNWRFPSCHYPLYFKWHVMYITTNQINVVLLADAVTTLVQCLWADDTIPVLTHSLPQSTLVDLIIHA